MAGLWAAVILSGFYHGANPGMGWPLAISAALFERRASALWPALAALAIGHLIAMLAVLLPFALVLVLVEWQREIQIAAALAVMAFGGWLLVNRRHPRFLARVPPSRLMLWSFLVAVAHGAALMLVPIYLGICRVDETDAGHLAAGELMRDGLGVALVVATVHTAAMIAMGGTIAYCVYRWLGLRFLKQGWLDLELLWAASLVAVGGLALAMAL